MATKIQRICAGLWWGLCALRHVIQISMEAIWACHPARSTEWLDWVAKSCELWRIRTGPIGHQSNFWNFTWLLQLMSSAPDIAPDSLSSAEAGGSVMISGSCSGTGTGTVSRRWALRVRMRCLTCGLEGHIALHRKAPYTRFPKTVDNGGWRCNAETEKIRAESMPYKDNRAALPNSNRELRRSSSDGARWRRWRPWEETRSASEPGQSQLLTFFEIWFTVKEDGTGAGKLSRFSLPMAGDGQ